MAVGLTYGHAPARAQSTTAQSTSAPVPTLAGDDDKPWNKGVPVETREAARALLLEGNRLFKVPLFARAAEQYTLALSKWKHPAFYFNLALAQLNLGQEVEAHDNLKEAIRQGEEPLGAEQFQEAQKQLQELERQLGRIRVTCPTPGAEVTLDGAPLFTGPGSYEGWIKTKNHEITAKKPDYLPKAKRVTVSPGELATIDLPLLKLSEAQETRWAVWKPWAVVASGAVVAIASGGLHALSRQGFNTYDGRFQQLPCVKSGCTEGDIGSDLNGRLSRARLEQKIAVGGYIAGGSVIAAGAVLLYLNRPHLAEQEATSSPARGVAVVPTISADMLGVLVTVSH
jgi:hypothetical protein